MIKSLSPYRFLQVFILLLLPMAKALSQPLTLEACYQLARDNYPLIKKYDLIQKSSAYSLRNASNLYLPQLTISGQATYQSQTIAFPAALAEAPGVSLPSISKDQYKIQGEVTQALYDGGTSHNQKAITRANEKVQAQTLETNLYAVRERVNQLYFSILLMDEQLKQNEIRIEDIRGAAAKAEAAYANGTAYRSNVDELQAEIANAAMASIEFKAGAQAYRAMLSQLIGQPVDDATELVLPAPKPLPTDIHRPELMLYAFQQHSYDVQEKNLRADYMPRLSAFFQGAYGRPTLNIINNEAGAWYITGVRLNWNLGSLYSLKNNRRILEMNRQSVEADKETFLFNTRLTLTQQSRDAQKYQALLQEDERAVALRASVKKSAQAQFDNGVITSHDLITQLNAENLARQTQILHTLQLRQAEYNANHTSGNE